MSDFDKINNILDSVFDTLDILKIQKVDKIKFLPGSTGCTVELSCDGDKNLFMGVSEYGFVEIVRKGSTTGEIVYAPNDDHIDSTSPDVL